MDCFSYWHFLYYLVAQLASHCCSMFFTQQTSCLPCTLLLSLPSSTPNSPSSLYWVLQPELLLKVMIVCSGSRLRHCLFIEWLFISNLGKSEYPVSPGVFWTSLNAMIWQGLLVGVLFIDGSKLLYLASTVEWRQI